MLLKCLIDHNYQDFHAKAGDVYEVDDFLGARLLRDYGPGDSSENAKRGNAPKFEATTERPTDPDKPPVGGEEVVIDNTLPEPEGETEATAAKADPKAEPKADPKAETPPPTRSGR